MLQHRKKLLISVVLGTLAFFAAVQFSWIQAASAVVFSEDCNPTLLENTKRSVETLFGSVQSKPIIRCLSKPAFVRSVSYGRTDFAVALPSIILLGPKGMNIDVAAHEWAHAELSSRLGIIPKAIFFPVWLDEGIAMQVDARANYSEQALQRYLDDPQLNVPQLSKIASRKFYTGQDQGRLHYALSRCIVDNWLSKQQDPVAALASLDAQLSPEETRNFSQAKSDCLGE